MYGNVIKNVVIQFSLTIAFKSLQSSLGGTVSASSVRLPPNETLPDCRRKSVAFLRSGRVS
jgi:hypothetical protein